MIMSSPIVRKKRNFKALQLDVTKSAQPTPQPSAPATQPVEPKPTRNPPAANGRRRPPPMKLAAPAIQTQTTNEDNFLTVSQNTSNSAPATGALSATRPYHNDLTQKLANLNMNAETKYDLRNEDLKELQELGQGNGGSVKKVQHVPTGKTMAKKVGVISSENAFLLAVVSAVAHPCCKRKFFFAKALGDRYHHKNPGNTCFSLLHAPPAKMHTANTT